MGQHKHNPTAIAAKNGELPPKPVLRKPLKVRLATNWRSLDILEVSLYTLLM